MHIDRDGANGAGRGGMSAKARYASGEGRWFWPSLGCAAAVHFLVFLLSPSWSVAGPPEGGTWRPGGMEVVNVPSSVVLPAPPERIAVPAVPVVEVPDLGLERSLTIEPVRFEERLRVEIPPPATARDAEALERFRHWVPAMVKPELKNPDEVRRALEERYPRTLVSEGIGGEVLMWFWIDEHGAVEKFEVKRSSGEPALDAAATEVVELMEFRPALDHGRPVPVIVALPIRFRTR